MDTNPKISYESAIAPERRLRRIRRIRHMMMLAFALGLLLSAAALVIGVATGSRFWLPIDVGESTIGVAINGTNLEHYWRQGDFFKYRIEVPLWMPAVLFACGLLILWKLEAPRERVNG